MVRCRDMRRRARICALATACAGWLASAYGCNLDLKPYVDPIDAATSVVTDSGNGATDAGSDGVASQQDASTDSNDAGDLSTRKRIFVTSTTKSGNLGGVNGANDECQQRATAAKLGGTFIAWL